MTARKPRSPFDFSRVTLEMGPSGQVEQVSNPAPEAPPTVEAELDILEAPAVAMAAPDETPPAPATTVDPAAEPPLPPAVLAKPERIKEPSGAPIWIGASLAVALWAIAPVAYALGWK